MYFFNCTCLCLSGYKPYIIEKTKFESDCQIIGSAQNESFHERKMKRTCFNPCRGLRGVRRSRPQALTGEAPRPPSSREGNRPAGGGRSFRRWKELRKAFSKLHMLHMHHMPDTHQAYDVFFSFFERLRSFPADSALKKTTFPVIPLNPSP